MSAEKRRREDLREALGRQLSGWLKLIDVLVFPSFCELCGSFLEKRGEKVLCLDCREKLRPCLTSYCLACGRFFEGSGEPHICSECLQSPSPFAKHRSCGRYSGVVKDAILLFKYRGHEILGRYLGDFVFRTLGEEEDLWHGVDTIIPVPLHRRRENKRGYNQAALLARRLAGLKGIPWADNRLVKVRNNPAQTSLDALEREANVKGAYEVKRPEGLKGKTVLLIDDVFTTGATIRECSRVLKRAGVREVRAITVAQA